ncbi:MAG: DNA gyrase subunit A [Bacteroidetes bacterium]|jgi:DNA gyrase subunit A|nr:DNA gyrase subunit A [Bacteroidota bacterium]
MADSSKIIPIQIEEEMKSAYIDYSMSVIVSRALPDVRDGLKPVHRRVLFGMNELGLAYNKPYKKSARIVGEVLGKYHPHGDSSVYDTMVRMAQPWSMRYPLVDGQGNFGSVDGDSPAAMRYTEARLTRLAEEMLEDIDKETVDFQLNFDDSLEEPTVMPCKFPHLLMNGSAGIAVGMATNMAPHNLSELIDGIHAYIDRRDITCDELLAYVKAPDFPTGGLLYGYEGIRDALLTGRGRVVIRARATVEVLDNGRERIIVTEIPYLVNKADMLQKTGDLVNEKKLEGISEIRDESDRDGMRIVYEIRKDAMASVVLNHLYKYTALQSSFSVNNIALVNGRPQALNLLDLIRHFVDHRHEVVLRRTRYDLAEAQRKAHILEGYLIALDHLDEIISLIRASATPDIAKEGLMSQFGLSEIQSKAILELRLQRLTGMERDKIRQEYNEIMALISRLQAILEDEGLRMSLIKDELTGIKERFGDARRSEIVYAAGDFRMEDMIEEEDVVVTVSHLGYIKRTAAHEYRVQNRGGKGAMGGATRDHDFIEHMLVASTHHWMLFFTEQGRCYWLKVYEIPEGAKNTKGRAVQNLLQIPQDDKIRAYISVRSLDEQEYLDSNYIVFCTRSGVIKKTTLEAYSRPRANGINAININEGDQLLEARLTNGQSEMVMATNTGRAIRFHESKVRPMGRTATGVRGVSLDSASEFVIGMVCVQNPETTLLVVSETGYGKRSGIEDYRVTNRGGKGVRTLNITEKTGALVALQAVDEQDDLMIINKSGVTIRIGVESLRVMGRATQGVRLIKLHGDDRIASVALVQKDEHEPSEIQPSDENIEPNENQDPTNLS